ncbi:MAG: hypothetical protein J0M17_04665 [Planctomycetes bacterium]|nr:hypothetical protein [Planctomycetota bacterium]
MVNILSNSFRLVFQRFVPALASATLAIVLVGCQREAATPQAEDHSKHAMGQGHKDHGGQMATTSRLMVVTEPATPAANADTVLSLEIMNDANVRVREFEKLHDKLVHLIVVRDGLDHFAHLHPDVAADGKLSTTFRFPAAGRYRLYADFQAKGGQAMTATTVLTVAGIAPTAPSLTPDVPGSVSSDGLIADVAVAGQGLERTVTYHLKDAAGMPMTDLQPYLGAMGHLVIIRAESGEYIHAHPKSDRKDRGEVAFEAHFTGPGLYKAWGQFQREGRVLTIPGVIDLQLSPDAK